MSFSTIDQAFGAQTPAQIPLPNKVLGFLWRLVIRVQGSDLGLCV